MKVRILDEYNAEVGAIEVDRTSLGHNLYFEVDGALYGTAWVHADDVTGQVRIELGTLGKESQSWETANPITADNGWAECEDCHHPLDPDAEVQFWPGLRALLCELCAEAREPDRGKAEGMPA